MERREFKARQLIDYLFAFPDGVDAGRAAILLPKTQMSSGVNTTVRGDFVKPRPPVKKIALTFDAYAGPTTQADFEDGLFQGCAVYNPDNGTDALMASISGRLFKLEISGSTAAVSDVSIPGDLNDATQLRAWMWQGEKWMIVNDGTQRFNPAISADDATPPLFYDGSITRRSNAWTPVTYNATLVNAISVPNVGSTVSVTLSIPFTGTVGDVININPAGGFTVTDTTANPTLVVSNLNAKPIGAIVAAGNTVNWASLGNELRGGRMGVYGLGRNWVCTVDGKQFYASDLVGGSSGTKSNNYRDAVLNMTENNYLLGGGYFTIPGSYGEIRAFCFAETLDSSLGQGPLQVFTDKNVFSCNAPVDRTTWQDMVNPILTESGKGGGGLSQWSTYNVNSDIISRARDGIRSWKLTRREDSTWGNVPISREVQPQIDRDSDDLLRFVSGCEFDNRSLELSEGVLNATRGVYFKRIIVINNDPVSSLRGKAPAVYDALYWQGLNVFRIIKGTFNNTERCFMFTLNNFTAKIELWELLPSATTEIYDDVNTRIQWSFEAFLDFDQKDPRVRERLSLDQGEIYVDDLRGQVDFQVYYRPDSWPCWVPWHSWQECSTNTGTDTQPSFRPNMGLPEPDPGPCDPVNDRPLREGYTYHIKVVVTGHCRFMGLRIGAWTKPQPEWARPVCAPICPDTTAS